MSARALPADSLTRAADPAAYDFESTAELEPLDRLVGQERPLEALEFGLAIESAAFNIFVVGDQGTGRRAAAMATLQRTAAARPLPDDWCYVNNFDDPRRPRALRLPPGTARRLAADMERLATQFTSDLPRVFGSDEYRAQRTAILRRLEEEQKRHLAEVEAEADRRGLAVLARPQAVLLVPKRDGHVLSEEEVGALSPEQREAYERAQKHVQALLERTLPRVADAVARAQQEMQALNRSTAESIAAHVLRELRTRYRELPQVLAFLDAVERDLLHVIGRTAALAQADPEVLARTVATDEFQRRYMVNVVVAQENDGAPVIEEPNPSFANLLGRIEHRVLQGVLTTDFLMIRAGALLRANGGFVLLDAFEVLRRPLAWDALKRSLKQCELRIEEPAAELGIVSTVSLQPEPIPLDVRVVVFGPPILYYLLSLLDPDFQRIFKVKADFSPTLPRSSDSEHGYARMIAARCRLERLPHFDAHAVGALVEYGSRRAGDQTRLTARLSEIADVVREAAFCARRRAADGGAAPEAAPVTGEDVAAALAARVRRLNRLEEEVHRHIETGTLFVRTRGTAVGQVNGLSVIAPGDYAFAKPVRVSATVAMGTRGVVDIEREAELGGKIHSKGVLILGGYLNRRYGAGRPLVLTATLGFEQVYEGVEGDSASIAELLALLSSIAGLPVRQDVAVTGSVNQHGDAQPVGAVTEKVEGFYHACRIQGLTGSQGVLVPAANVRHLMLLPVVRDAVAAGEFHVFAAENVDEAAALLFDRPADEVHDAVEKRLDAMLAEWRRLRLELGGPEMPLPRPSPPRAA